LDSSETRRFGGRVHKVLRVLHEPESAVPIQVALPNGRAFAVEGSAVHPLHAHGKVAFSNSRFGMQMEDMQVNLYSRKILIKSNCRDLLPNYMRFVKGVVDCEDLPLNISRENYQDSQLIAKLKNILTKRVLKLLTEEAEKDEAVYLQWYNDF